MVHPAGFEPATSWFEAKRSIQMSYRCMHLFSNISIQPRRSGGAGNRGSDHRFADASEMSYGCRKYPYIIAKLRLIIKPPLLEGAVEN